jgi:transcriptional regulator with XRE-family HTH domain
MAEIGSTLREARMRARIDMSEVESRTKIRAKYLRAIENEEWDLLPGSVYAKSFLRTYGDFLGLDSRMLIDEFKRRYERPADHETRPVAPLGRERERRRQSRLPHWAPVAIVVAVILVLLFIVGLATQPSGTTTAKRHHTPRHHALPAARVAPVRPAAPATARLQLVPTGTVYVCLVNGAGRKLIDERTFTVTDTIPTERARRLLLTLGNASVSMKVNGKPVDVAPSPNAIRLEITPVAVTHIPLSQAPTCP